MELGRLALEKKYEQAKQTIQTVKGSLKEEEDQLSILLERARQVRDEMSKQIPRILKSCRLLATTTAYLLSTQTAKPALERKWDYVVVDEASACPPLTNLVG